MHVIATAGHVDHGKSTLVRRLTGMEPDRWAEERRRGLTIDLGFAWTTLPSGEQVAFVDVPGHDRFVPNMLAGVGPVPAVVLVVAADGGWMPQSQEHLDALTALDVRSGVAVVSRSDLADPAPVAAEVRRRLADSSLRDAPVVAVSAVSGAGLAELVKALEALVRELPPTDPADPVRLWVDRSFTVKGAGTVVTGTLPAGAVEVGDELTVTGGHRVTVRGIQVLGQQVERADAVCRVALNLRGVDRHDVARGDALLGDGPWTVTEAVDVGLEPHDQSRPQPSSDAPGRPPTHPRSEPADAVPLPTQAVLHVGSAAVPVRLRPLGNGAARLLLARPLPLAVGDRGVLRAPDRHAVLTGVRVLDADPPPLQGRGAGRRRAEHLAVATGPQRWAAELRRRRFLPEHDLAALGLVPQAEPVVDGWFADPDYWRGLPAALRDVVTGWSDERPLEPGVPVVVVVRRLELPAASLVPAVARAAALVVEDGRVRLPGPQLPAGLESALAELEAVWRTEPFTAPEAGRLRALGLARRELAAAARAGRVLEVADGVVLPAGADRRAAAVLAGVPAPFTVSQARQALGTSRRVAVPLLELLDRQGLTERVSPDLRTVTRSGR